MRLIDALELKRSLTVSALVEAGKHIFDIIDDQPTIEERKTGKWIEVVLYPYRACSECGATMYSYEPANFCPNCGADMRGDNNG